MTALTPGACLLTGLPGRDGFVFHDGHNQPVHQAAPGLLGILEGRQAVSRWRPGIVAWMDGAGHFFDHLLHELDGAPGFDALARELVAIRQLDAPAPAASRFLFHHVGTLAAGLEREGLSARRAGPVPELAPSTCLNGEWSAYYRRGPGDYVTSPVRLPGNWEGFAGIENYAGSMRFTRCFRLPADTGDRRLFLEFGGVDYFADVWVNGHHAGGHEGAFTPFELDVTPFVRTGGVNVVRLAVASPNEPAGEGTSVASGWGDFRPRSSFPNRKSLVKGTLGHHDAKRGGAWSSMTSQDANTGGPWGDIHLAARPAVHFDPAGTRVTTRSAQAPAAGDPDGGAVARVAWAFAVRNTTGAEAAGTLHVELVPANFEGPRHRLATPVRLGPGTDRVDLDCHLAGLRLWEPWDQGFPHLYRVRATLELDGATVDETVLETGFRTLAVTPLGESPGPDGAFVVNGHPVFVRGTNLLPTYWLSEYGDARVARDFTMLRAAGFNAVLVHALVGPKRLYREANRAGMLVVQLAPLQWTYEQSAEVVARATDQLREMAGFLHNEPSVVSYETHNEPDMRVTEGLDNRQFDFLLHAALREADPSRWATTYSGGNHCYPGQFYAMRDDTSFATLPGRFEHDHYQGRRIARHRNMPTEFGIQAMPGVELFTELLSEDRVRAVLRRLHTDRRWTAQGGEPWATTSADLDAITRVLGGGNWAAALETFDWRRLWRLGDLEKDLAALRAARPGPDADPEVLSVRLALLLLEVLHYGAFKGENFWFGDWKPAATLADFVGSSQRRQYRIHKDAIESYLNGGIAGPIVGFFSFMFRDPDRQAPTWGVVDGAWAPKAAYRAYVESNQPVRATLPQALQSAVKLPGSPWFGVPEGRERPVKEPWTTAELLVANDSGEGHPGARVALWLEDDTGARIALTDRAGRRRASLRFAVDLEARGGAVLDDLVPAGAGSWVVPGDLPAGTYRLRASVTTAGGRRLSTNGYDFVLLDTGFDWAAGLAAGELDVLLSGPAGAPGFHFWDGWRVALMAPPGVRGLVAGFREAADRGVNVYEVVQGEHLFRHLLAELGGFPPAEPLLEDVWTIRSEIVSPAEKAAVLVAYLDAAADALAARAGTTPTDRPPRDRPREMQP